MLPQALEGLGCQAGAVGEGEGAKMRAELCYSLSLVRDRNNSELTGIERYIDQKLDQNVSHR